MEEMCMKLLGDVSGDVIARLDIIVNFDLTCCSMRNIKPSGEPVVSSFSVLIHSFVQFVMQCWVWELLSIYKLQHRKLYL